MSDVTDLLLRYGPQLLAFAAFATALGFAVRHFLRSVPPNTQRTAVRYVFVGFLYMLTAANVLDAFMDRWGFRGDAERYGFEATINFESQRPLVYRVLSPLLIRTARDAVPARWAENNSAWLLENSPLLAYRQPGETWNLQKSVGWHVAYGFEFICVLLGLVVARLFLREMAPALPHSYVDFAPAIGALFLPMSFIHGGYLYDFPELLLLLSGALFIARWKWRSYYAVFLLAVLNKETGAMLGAYFLALNWDRMPRKSLISHLLVQGFLAVVIVVGVRYVFREQPGVLSESWFMSHLLTWTDVRSYFRFFDFVAPLIMIPRATNVIALGLLAGLLAMAWAQLSAGLRRLLAIMACVNIPLVLLGGFPDEMRNFSLLFPPIFASCAVGVFALYQATARNLAR